MKALVVGLWMLLVFPAGALAAPPANDNRATAEVIPTFPATVDGTTVEATLERLDPQVSQCGRVESTVWYRINQAPDGTVVIRVSGAGFAPVLRVYDLVRNGIREGDCASARVGGAAQVTFETERGASYLVLVGKRPGTADATFRLTAELFLPPANDARSQARPVGRLPAKVAGSTFGATTDDGDPLACGLVGGTVWYSLSPGRAQRIVVQLHAAGDLDATALVLRRIRSQTRVVRCQATNARGNATVAFEVDRGARYLVAVGQRRGSPPGNFVLRILAAQPPEGRPGSHLPIAGIRSSVNGLTDVNDIWWVSLRAGTTYRVAFSSTRCASLSFRRRDDVLRTLSCSGYTTFTPGPDGGGRYTMEITAPTETRASAYRLAVARAGPDDLGVGLELVNLSTVRGRLAPSGVDVVDLYHFDVGDRSEVRLRLGTPTAEFSLLLLTDTGRRLATSDREIRRQLSRGRYVVAVSADVGTSSGAYSLSLVVRQLTTTALSASSTILTPGAAVVLTLATLPAPDGGWTELQIDRFDPLTGWQFHRLTRVRAPGGSVTWTPPAPGRWRARATFLGTLRFSPSRSGYVRLLVAKPLPAR